MLALGSLHVTKACTHNWTPSTHQFSFVDYCCCHGIHCRLSFRWPDSDFSAPLHKCSAWGNGNCFQSRKHCRLGFYCVRSHSDSPNYLPIVHPGQLTPPFLPVPSDWRPVPRANHAEKELHCLLLIYLLFPGWVDWGPLLWCHCSRCTNPPQCEESHPVMTKEGENVRLNEGQRGNIQWDLE